MNVVELRSTLNASKSDVPFLEISLLVDGSQLVAEHFVDLLD